MCAWVGAVAGQSFALTLYEYFSYLTKFIALPCDASAT